MSSGSVPLWRNRAFSIFWLAQSLSYTGSQVSEFAIPLAGGLLGQALGLRPALFLLAAGGLSALPWVVVAAARRQLDRAI